METWEFEGEVYRVESAYVRPKDAWTYELTGPRGASGSLAVVIPDATPEGSFTPAQAGNAVVAAGSGPLPWPVVVRFRQHVGGSADIVGDDLVSGPLPATVDHWEYAGRDFAVGCASRDAWYYKISDDRTGDVEVRIPESEGPCPPERVVLTVHGSPALPWPVFRHFVDLVADGGDIVRALPVRREPPRRTAEFGIAAPAPKHFGAGGLDLVLVAPGHRMIQVIAEVRRITGIGLHDAVQVVESRPGIIAAGLDDARATEFQAALHAIGATTEITAAE